MEKKKEIKKGTEFLCTMDVVINGTSELSYKEGCIYLSEGEGCITDEEGDASHVWLDGYSDSEWEDGPEDYFIPLQEVEYVWTESTPELKKLFENCRGKREGQRKDMSKVYYFSNVSANPQDTAFTAHEYLDPMLDGMAYFMTPGTFIEHLGLRNDSEKQTQKRLLEKMMGADEDSGIYEERRGQFPRSSGVDGREERGKPKHYSKGIDTFERMEANCTKEECLAFAKGNIDKYNWRDKGQDLEDFDKIIAYAEWAKRLLNN